jgi:hypothetical protein
VLLFETGTSVNTISSSFRWPRTLRYDLWLLAREMRERQKKPGKKTGKKATESVKHGFQLLRCSRVIIMTKVVGSFTHYLQNELHREESTPAHILISSALLRVWRQIIQVSLLFPLPFSRGIPDHNTVCRSNSSLVSTHAKIKTHNSIYREDTRCETSGWTWGEEMEAVKSGQGKQIFLILVHGAAAKETAF